MVTQISPRCRHCASVLSEAERLGEVCPVCHKPLARLLLRAKLRTLLPTIVTLATVFLACAVVVGPRWSETPTGTFATSFLAGIFLLGLGYCVYRTIRARSPVRDIPKAIVPLVFGVSAFLVAGPVTSVMPFDFLERTIVHDAVSLMVHGLAFGLTVASARHAGRVRVLFLRSFQSDPDGEMALVLKQTCRHIGRTEALRPPTFLFSRSQNWGLIGHMTRWRVGVQRIMERSQLVIVDVSISSENLEWELSQLAQRPDVPRIYIAKRPLSHTIVSRLSPDPKLVLEYTEPSDLEFVSNLLQAIERTLSLSGRGWEGHKRKCLRRFA